MVGPASELLSPGTNLAAGDSYGSGTSRMQTAGCAPLQPDNECGRNSMAWFYEIRDSNKAVAETGKGFDTHKAAMAAGRKKARELKASGS
jgi:hypothetical protein